jgi:hypothetical protein
LLIALGCILLGFLLVAKGWSDGAAAMDPPGHRQVTGAHLVFTLMPFTMLPLGFAAVLWAMKPVGARKAIATAFYTCVAAPQVYLCSYLFQDKFSGLIINPVTVSIANAPPVIPLYFWIRRDYRTI